MTAAQMASEPLALISGPCKEIVRTSDGLSIGRTFRIWVDTLIKPKEKSAQSTGLEGGAHIPGISGSSAL